jgi:hypothetical protein
MGYPRSAANRCPSVSGNIHGPQSQVDTAAILRRVYGVSRNRTAFIVRALQPPFVALTEKIVRVSSPSINHERNSARFMIFVGVCFALMGTVYLSDRHRPYAGVAYLLLGAANIAISLWKLQLLHKRASKSTVQDA